MITVALKEWAIVWDLLLEGRFALLLRKGGIHEAEGPGRFRLEHMRFGTFPAWEHQKPVGIKPELRDRVHVMDEPDEVDVLGYGQAERIWEVPSRAAFDTLDDLHPWSGAQIDMRFNYKPDRPLYLVAVRAYRLAEPRRIPNRPEYAGCKSWVPLEMPDAIDPAGATPAMDGASFEALLARVDAAMAG